MSTTTAKVIGGVAGAVCLAALLGSFLYLRLQVMFAEEQTRIFDEMRAKAIGSSTPSAIAGALEYVAKYYPSGTKQPTGSRLDGIVERQRASAIREIIAHLRLITGSDLGDDPEPWIREYARQ